MGPEPVVGQVTPGRGTLYRVERAPDGEVAITVTPAETNLDISNGMAWDAAETKMYYIDTPQDRVDVFDFDLDNGTISKYIETKSESVFAVGTNQRRLKNCSLLGRPLRSSLR